MEPWNGLIRWNLGFEYIIPMVGSTQEKSKISRRVYRDRPLRIPAQTKSHAPESQGDLDPQGREPLHAPNHANSNLALYNATYVPMYRNHLPQDTKPDHYPKHPSSLPLQCD